MWERLGTVGDGTPLDMIAQAVLSGCFLIFLAVWAIAALFTKRTVERSGWSWRLTFVIIVVAGLALGRHGPAAALVREPLWRPNPASDVAAMALAIAGLAIMLWARATLGRNWSGSVVLKQDHELVTRGPYAYVRHPIYTGLLTMVLAYAVLHGRVGGFAWLAVWVVAFLWKARSEEQLMTRHFPEAYPAYRARVKALVPYVF